MSFAFAEIACLRKRGKNRVEFHSILANVNSWGTDTRTDSHRMKNFYNTSETFLNQPTLFNHTASMCNGSNPVLKQVLNNSNLQRMKRNITSILMVLAVICSLSWVNNAVAAPAYPYPVEFTQSNGTVVTIIMKGDEKVRWAETLDGYSIMYNAQGDFEYAILNSKGDMTPSGILAENVSSRSAAQELFLSSVQKNLTYSREQVSILKQIWDMNEAEKSAKAFPTTGNRKLVCLLIGFKDKAFTKTKAEFQNLFNQVGYTTGGATGSVKDFYLENSWNQFDLTVDVFGPYTASQNMSYYGANDASGNDVKPRELVLEAVNAADAEANYANYDNDGDGSVDGVYVIYAGYGEEAGGGANCIWAHAWNISTVTRDGKTISKYSCSAELSGNSGTTLTAIGVICHEFGHVLGAPDYYDTNYATGGQYSGTSSWDMMAGGSWNNNGKTPAHHNAFTKVYFYNWATATTLTSAQTVTVTNAAENKSFYRINTTTSGEYYLIENREKHKFDAYVPGSGLIIYHVHSGVMTSASSNSINNTHQQRMYPVAQNATVGKPTSTASTYGTVDAASCAWTGASGTKNQFTDATTPNMKSWAGANTAKPITNIARNATTKTVTFDFMGGGTTVVVPTVSTTAATSVTTNSAVSGGNVTADGGASVTERGVVYATTQNPTTANSKVTSGTGTGSYSVNLTGLAASTTYYARAYAINSAGTAYGSQITFTTLANSTSLNLPVTENFNASTLPSGWTTQNTGTSITERWNVNNTANAGGAAYEMRCSYQQVSPGTTRLITPAINTVGVSQVTFSFRHQFDDYGAGATLRIQTSNDKSTWTNTTWSVASASNTTSVAATVNVTVTANLNSATTYFAFVVDGNLYQFDYWYVDNVSITAGTAATAPTVTTGTPSGVTASAATVTGNVTADGGASVTTRGICYATTQNPTTSSAKVAVGTGTGSFTANLTGLSASTTYYARAYATNSAGTSYGVQVSFTTLSNQTTVDVTIGTGTSTQGYPLNCYYGFERSASLYTAAELGKVGSISKVGWYPTVTSSTSIPVKIYIKQTTATTITATTWATMISGATLVYNGTMAGLTANTWREFVLSTAFNFTGGSNNLLVLVETNYGGAGTGTSTGPAIRYTSATSRHMYVRADNSAPTGNGTVTNLRPNIKITITTASGAPMVNNDEIEIGDENTIALQHNVVVYPNPTNGLINIENDGKIQSINVYTMTGQMVYSKSNIMEGSSNEVNLSDFENGIYLLVIFDGENYHNVRVIKQ
jgi:M6 family metalloprotease-like protein